MEIIIWTLYALRYLRPTASVYVDIICLTVGSGDTIMLFTAHSLSLLYSHWHASLMTEERKKRSPMLSNVLCTGHTVPCIHPPQPISGDCSIVLVAVPLHLLLDPGSPTIQQ